jgi:hypothetical protein
VWSRCQLRLLMIHWIFPAQTHMKTTNIESCTLG